MRTHDVDASLIKMAYFLHHEFVVWLFALGACNLLLGVCSTLAQIEELGRERRLEFVVMSCSRARLTRRRLIAIFFKFVAILDGHIAHHSLIINCLKVLFVFSSDHVTVGINYSDIIVSYFLSS